MRVKTPSRPSAAEIAAEDVLIAAFIAEHGANRCKPGPSAEDQSHGWRAVAKKKRGRPKATSQKQKSADTGDEAATNDETTNHGVDSD